VSEGAPGWSTAIVIDQLTLCFVEMTTVLTYCCTFLLLFLFFSPNVLSSMTLSAWLWWTEGYGMEWHGRCEPGLVIG